MCQSHAHNQVASTNPVRTKTCMAPWCTNPTAKAAGAAGRRGIGDYELCRSCYNYVWTYCRKYGLIMAKVFPHQIPPPDRPLPRIETTCARAGCHRHLPAKAGAKVRRAIGLFHLCNHCYQSVWYLAKQNRISLEEAWEVIPPKGWKPAPPEPVRCSIPWCSNEFVMEEESVVAELHVCGHCRAHFKMLCHRPMHQHLTWQEMARQAITDPHFPRPDKEEECSAPWCNRREITTKRTPNGLPLCNTDYFYFRRYAKRHGITPQQAFETAPPPLVHGNQRK